MFKDGRIDKAHKALRPLWWGQVIQIIVGSIVMLVFAPYWVNHRHTPHLLIYGLCMHAYGLLFVLTAVRNLYLQSRLDYVAPVLEIQRRIAALRGWRLHQAVLRGRPRQQRHRPQCSQDPGADRGNRALRKRRLI